MPDEPGQRGQWGRQVEFFLSCLGYAVGVGNLWRFPYLCMRNGGGAFLIPYFLSLFLCGMPLYFLELALGQYSSLSPMCVWKFCPLFEGLGYAMVLVSGIVCVYYNVILAWSLYYLGKSFTIGELPWASCGNWWNTPQCLERIISPTSPEQVNTTANSSKTTPMAVIDLYPNISTSTTNFNYSLVRRTPAEEFWRNNVLQISEGISEPGNVRWELLLCLLAAWILVFACVCKGIKSSGKVVYVTAIVPYILIFIFLVRGLLLDGAWDGVYFYLAPDWKRLTEFGVWGEACSQIFFSLGPAYGGLITMSSYNRFTNNCQRDAVLVSVINCLTSFVAGFVIFSIIGHMAKHAGLSVEKVITSGPGLAFSAYPEAMTTMPISPIWAVLFFLMLIIIGLDTQFCMFETLVSGFIDAFPRLRERKTLVAAAAALMQFILGLTMVTNGGVYVFQIMDWYSATFSLMVIATMECVVVSWVYGADRLYGDIEKMLGYRPFILWKIAWKLFTPLLMFVVLVSTLVTFNSPTYGVYVYPKWAKAFGWAVGFISLVPIPVVMIIKILKRREDNILTRVRCLCRPEADWGPAGSKKNCSEYKLTAEKFVSGDDTIAYDAVPTDPCISKDTYT